MVLRPRPDFYLYFAEDAEPEEWTRCYVIDRIEGNRTKDLLLVRIDPPKRNPLKGDPEWYDRFLLAPKVHGETLCPIERFPIWVHVCHLKTSYVRGTPIQEETAVDLLTWAELYGSYWSLRRTIKARIKRGEYR